MEVTSAASLAGVEPSGAIERRNKTVFIIANLLIYFSAPVTYVGVLHAGLLNALGLNATFANLPESASLVGYCAPLLVTQFCQTVRPQTVISWAYGSMGVSLVVMGGLLLTPAGATPLAIAVILQSLIVGASLSLAQVFMLRCLKAGTRPGESHVRLSWHSR